MNGIHANEPRLEELERRTNLRQLGGYRAADGRRVKPNLLFRSGELAELNAEDVALLEGSGLRYICDLRTEAERQSKPNPPVAGAEDVSLPAMGGAVNPQEMMEQLMRLSEESKGEGVMKASYKQFVTDPVAQDAFRRLFELVLRAEGRPVLWHCAAGKDRTGFAAAVLLLALDVPVETVMEDYLRSNANRIEANGKLLRRIGEQTQDERFVAVVRDMLGVRASYLAAALEEIGACFGTVEAYLEEALGLTSERRDRLKDLVLM